jgi:hypothetical protein
MGVVVFPVAGLGYCGDTVRSCLDTDADVSYLEGDMLRSLAILGCV